jgi:hypothetical protein
MSILNYFHFFETTTLCSLSIHYSSELHPHPYKGAELHPQPYKGAELHPHPYKGAELHPQPYKGAELHPQPYKGAKRWNFIPIMERYKDFHKNFLYSHKIYIFIWECSSEGECVVL